MTQKATGGWYISPLMKALPQVVHAYSTRAFGDMRVGQNKERFLHALGVDCSHLVYPQQIHGNDIAVASQDHREAIVGVDGVVSVSDRILAVRVADCAPVIAVDPTHGVIGVAHAGWKGTEGHISVNLIEVMISKGASIKDIRVSVGPHIGACCYTISLDRARRFFSYNDDRVVRREGNNWKLDIGHANYVQLKQVGLGDGQIDISTLCTSCHSDEFFSYRKDSKETFGEIVGVIGLTA